MSFDAADLLAGLFKAAPEAAPPEPARRPEAGGSPARRGDCEAPGEALARQAAAIERLRLDREAFVEKARKAGLYRGPAVEDGPQAVRLGGKPSKA